MTARAFLPAILLLGMDTHMAQSGEKADPAMLRKAIALYASFDDAMKADKGGGDLTFHTRSNHPTEKGKFVFSKGFDEKAFRIAKDRGLHGGALEAVDVLPNNGRIFFPAKENIAFKKGGWGGAVSVWINTDPDRLLKTTFCDPIQITEKGANNGGIWFDFNNDKPRTMRMGVFPAQLEGKKAITEADPDAPLVAIPKPGFREGKWHHVVLSWDNLDTGKNNGKAILYIDGAQRGALKNRDLAMAWDIEKAGIYVAVNYIGLLDELAVFDRALTNAEVTALFETPGILAGR